MSADRAEIERALREILGQYPRDEVYSVFVELLAAFDRGRKEAYEKSACGRIDAWFRAHPEIRYVETVESFRALFNLWPLAGNPTDEAVYSVLRELGFLPAEGAQG